MNNAGTPLLEVRGLVKDYPGVRALGGVDLTVNSGQVHCLIGQNGAGKSTLIKCVSGLVEPTAGEVRLVSMVSKCGSGIQTPPSPAASRPSTRNLILSRTFRWH